MKASKNSLINITYFIVWVIVGSCSNTPLNDNLLERALSSENRKIKRVMDSLEQYEVQIRYTRIERKNDSILFSDFDFQVDEIIISILPVPLNFLLPSLVWSD